MLAHIVAEKLRRQWSPEQIAGWLKRTYSDDASCQVSHETIYRSLFIQSRGALKKELLEHLRRTRAMRRSRHHTQKTDDHGRITGTVSISERPAQVEDRAVPGHWEGDLLFGSKNSQVATLVERQTRYLMLVKVGGKDTQTVINASPSTSNAGPGNSVLGNSFHDNGNLAINIGRRASAPSVNQATQTTFIPNLPNSLQNYPVLANAYWTAATEWIQGTLHTFPSQPIYVQVYADQDACQSNANVGNAGNGGDPLGSASVMTDASGNANFWIVLPSLGLQNDVFPYSISATATSAPELSGQSYDNTSEIGNCVTESNEMIFRNGFEN